MKQKDRGLMNMNKILFIATVPNFLTGFLENNFEILHGFGLEIHIATNFNFKSKKEIPDYIIKHHINIQRNPYNLKNLKAYNELNFIIKQYNINIIDCHTPMGGMLGRLIAKKNNLKCIYTAHGFHFYNGAPLINWLIYYPIEKWLSKYTDVLITINKEDYARAKNKFKMNQIEYIPGVGVDIQKFQLLNFDKINYRKKLGLNKNDFMILSVGELNKNKNHEIIVRAVAKLKNTNIHYFIAGEGNLKYYLKKLAVELNVDKQVHLLGYRSDIVELNNCADIFAFPSIREGLGLAAIEAMAAGKPIITSNTRGINDYSKNGVTGFKYQYNDINGFANGINILLTDPSLIKQMSSNCYESSLSFDKRRSYEILKSVYEKL